jgi:hypothetical protein
VLSSTATAHNFYSSLWADTVYFLPSHSHVRPSYLQKDWSF